MTDEPENEIEETEPQAEAEDLRRGSGLGG